MKKTTKYDVASSHGTFSQTILKKLEPEGQAEATNSGHSKANRKHICIQNKPYFVLIKANAVYEKFSKTKKKTTKYMVS